MAEPQPSESGERPRRVVGLLILVFIGFMALHGVGACLQGAQAIAREELDLEWLAGGGFVAGPVIVGGARQAGIEPFRGADAVRIGVGMLAWGSVFILWALLLLLSRMPGVARLALGDGWGARRKLATTCSLACLAMAAVALAPPWRIPSSPGATSFWLNVLVLCALVRWRPRPPWAGAALAALLVGALVAALFSPFAFAGIVMAFFFFLAVALHVSLFLSRGSLTSSSHDGA